MTKKVGISSEGGEAQPIGRALGQFVTSGRVIASSGMMTTSPSPGPLPPLPRQFTVTATGVAAERTSYLGYLGVFTRSKMWWRGRPVYTNNQGMLLHHGAGDLGWGIGPYLGKRALRGSQAHHSPESEKNWRYWTESEWKPASVMVTASD